MEIKVGGKYNHRGGGVEEIISYSHHRGAPFTGITGISYSNSGIVFGRLTGSPYDLISEYVEPCSECHNKARITPCPKCCPTEQPDVTTEHAKDAARARGESPPTPKSSPANYGPWALLDDCSAPFAADYAKDNDNNIIAYRELIEPEKVVYKIHTEDDRYACHGHVRDKTLGCRNITLTVQGDTIKAEWVT